MRPLTLAFANGVTTDYTYSPQRGWLNSILTQSGAATLQDLAYTRDAEGRIESLDSAVATETGTTRTTTCTG